ncbi:Mediator complex, subunit Med7 [Kalmanozyma brasiliensis GHG001]|uniref:Mediator complex, subunit Med7 n=1 Tax=Kalmanozyma brasiliensis (strain GHG001) TaxID=1365824 RepID=UPI001CE82BB4|nr:Mediator complex, subunit Med7 [Kalmanozyma brasiliensis GHG001]KAF6767036.1 Mediator complex, subunit Med7 [Kalmanozyma brasiliensis GHG001]
MKEEYDEAVSQQQEGAGDNAAAGPSNSNQISTSFFPPPPQVYKKFTKRNLRYLEILNSHPLADDETPWEELNAAERLKRQTAILRQHGFLLLGRSNDKQEGEDVEMDAVEGHDAGANAADLPDFDLKADLEPPNVDWIEEDGGYTVFGQLWPIPDVTPTLEQLGIPVLYPLEGTNRKELLLTLLQTLLQTYREITADLLKPAQPYDVWVPAVPDPNLTPEQQQQQMATNPGFWTQSTEAKDRLKHMQNVVVNMQFLINELRPVQARETLKLIMQMQLERRKQETQLIRDRCASMRTRVQQLKDMLAKQTDS